MVITFYFVISWVMMGLFIFNRKKSWGTKKEVAFLVLLSCLINSQTYLGLFETFKWMKTTIDPKLYIAFLLFRSVFIPLFVSFFTLLFFNWPNNKKLMCLFIYCLIILGLDKVSLSFELYRFKKWNHFFTLGYYLLYLFFMIIALKWFKRLDGKKVDLGDAVNRKRLWFK